jgi:hypothetical protein
VPGRQVTDRVVENEQTSSCSWRACPLFAVFVELDNSAEDPEEGRRGLREELAPAMEHVPGFVSALFMTAYDRGLGVGVVVLESRVQAEQFAAGFPPGVEVRPGATVRRTEVLEVSATA